MTPVFVWNVLGWYHKDDGKYSYQTICLSAEAAKREAETYIREAIENENEIKWDTLSDIYFTGEVELFDGGFIFECSYLEITE
jgi:hypothetical protein